MIKNILFDMGQVLVRWDPPRFTRRLGLGAEDARMLEREVFGDAEWVQLDRGAISDRDAWKAMCARLPERLHDAVWELMTRWDDARIEVEGTCEIVRELHEKGYGLYLLSNASLRHHEYWPKFPASEFFRGHVMISAEWGLLKPDPAFYEKAFELFSLDRSECVFIDDNPVNVESARRVGLDAIVFHDDAALLRRRLRERGVDITL